MSKANNNFKNILLCISIVALFIISNCTEDQPIAVEEPTIGSLSGTIRPVDVVALIEVSQGIWSDSTFSDSINGFFKIDSLKFGSYTLNVIARNYGRYVRNEVDIHTNGTKYLGEIHLKQLPEQIAAVIPSDKSENIQLISPCGFEFSIFMDRNSVENNFVISPEVTGHFEWTENSTNKSFYFQPESKFRTNTQYTFVLNTGAKTIYGDTLDFQVSSTFTTEPVKILAYSPDNGANYISPEAVIYIKFNSPMYKPRVESAFSIDNLVSGNFIWHNDESFSFKPDEVLATNREYMVTISSDARDIYDNSLYEPFNILFKTEPVRVTYTYPTNGATNVSKNTNIQVIFNTEMNQSATESAFSISPAIDGTISWSDHSKFTFIPENPFKSNTLYIVKIDTKCKDISDSTLPEDYAFNFKIEAN